MNADRAVTVPRIARRPISVPCDLESLGHSVVAETTVAGALRRLTAPQASFAQVVVDHDLPDGTGPEVAAVALILMPEVPVVLHTSRRDLHVIPLGVTRMIQKAPGLAPLRQVMSAA